MEILQPTGLDQGFSILGLKTPLRNSSPFTRRVLIEVGMRTYKQLPSRAGSANLALQKFALWGRWISSSQQSSTGIRTPLPKDGLQQAPKSPFYFDTGYALFAKRPSRPFPPPFLSLPSGSFSDPLSTHNRSRDRRSYVNGEMIRGITNGDDAVLVGENFIGANDGIGAWASREKGHAA